MSVTFVDEPGTNPLPAGVSVTVYFGSVLIVGGYTNAGGLLNVSLAPLTTYSASFVGTQAPTVSTSFTTDQNGNAAGVVVTPYRSPSLSVVGYANEQSNLWPVGWFADSAKAPGGNAYSVALALAGVLQWLDNQGQVVLSSMRLQSCVSTLLPYASLLNEQGVYVTTNTGQNINVDPTLPFINPATSDIDTWAYDFFGPQWTRFPQQSDASWYAMILGILQTQKCTIAGLQAIINLFWPWISAQFSVPILGEDDALGGEDATGGEDVAPSNQTLGAPGQAMGLDTYGGEDTGTTFEDGPPPAQIAPTPIVFDLQSNPTFAGYISLAPPQFGIYLQYPSYSDTLMHTSLPRSTILATLVNAWKATGTTPIYCQNR